MVEVVRGNAFLFGPNIDTDQIYPGRFLDITDPKEIGKHAMEGVVPDFCEKFKTGDIIVASTNFGCGSSREHAAVALKAIGIGAVLADSFGRIFYRNAINLGIPLVVCPNIDKHVKQGDILTVDITTGNLVNETTGITIKAQPLTGYVMSILQNGGIKSLIKSQYGQ
jgi:3-isopropylmalate/(R)-2-methylmalate dehydratase small subunit